MVIFLKILINFTQKIKKAYSLLKITKVTLKKDHKIFTYSQKLASF